MHQKPVFSTHISKKFPTVGGDTPFHTHPPSVQYITEQHKKRFSSTHCTAIIVHFKPENDVKLNFKCTKTHDLVPKLPTHRGRGCILPLGVQYIT